MDSVGPGTLLNGVYRIEKVIGQGGMGVVYKGRAVETGDAVAIKMLTEESAASDQARSLFRREAQALRNLHHDAIVRYFMFAVEPTLKRPYLVMDHVEGTPLSERLKGGPLDAGEVDALRRRLATGFAAAHRLGIVHRDVSPDNVLLPDGDVAKCKIIDFGIARSEDFGTTIIGSGVAGKYNFMSPEQVGLHGPITPASDIYGLGLVLAAAVNGQPLDMSGTHVEVVAKRQKLPDLGAMASPLRPLLERMLQPDPKRRPASMEEVAAWRPASAAGPPARAGSRRVLRPAASVLAGALLLGSGASLLWRPTPDGSRPPTPASAPTLPLPGEEARLSLPPREAESGQATHEGAGAAAAPPTVAPEPATAAADRAAIEPAPAPAAARPERSADPAQASADGPIAASTPSDAAPAEQRLAALPPVRPGEDAAAGLIRSAQVELRRLACYAGPVDGTLDGPTREAMELFARLNGLAWSGDVGENAVSWLRQGETGSCNPAGTASRALGGEREAESGADRRRSCAALSEMGQVGELSGSEYAELRSACR